MNSRLFLILMSSVVCFVFTLAPMVNADNGKQEIDQQNQESSKKQLDKTDKSGAKVEVICRQNLRVEFKIAIDPDQGHFMQADENPNPFAQEDEDQPALSSTIRAGFLPMHFMHGRISNHRGDFWIECFYSYRGPGGYGGVENIDYYILKTKDDYNSCVEGPDRKFENVWYCTP